ncbi:odorant receptor 59a [Lucilia cuprina]|uniref:odorant receptor 59a n=1 Tax=Lucilia cuprina TaxID=7375 RepID=UPI001F060AAA|nr:odorant receptor 59a [Lucilia cuprina]
MPIRKVNAAAATHNAEPNSYGFFKLHWLCWKILGITLDIDKFNIHRNTYLLYSIVLNIVVTICYPLHLALQLFRSELMADNIKNFAVCVTCVACSIKFSIYSTKLPVIRQFEQILKRLDERIKTEVEMNYFRQLRNRLRNVGLVFLSVYLPVGITAELSVMFREGRSLLYPAWFPFNWKESTVLFYVANIYQVVGIFILLLENYIDDTFPPMALCMLSGHIEILSIRVSNIGYDKKSLKENEEELDRCVEDQQTLYELYTTIENIISWPMFIQFCVTATNICVAMAALLFYVSTPLDILYYFVYFLAMPLQIFPTCYYGSDFQYLFDQLHRAIFASNWTDQTKKYKKHMILFTERSLKQNAAMAGGMVRIHLDTFFSTCRGAYSLFAIIMRMK